MYKPEQAAAESENIAETTINDLDSSLQAKKIANDIPPKVSINTFDLVAGKKRRRRPQVKRSSKGKSKKIKTRKRKVAKKPKRLQKGRGRSSTRKSRKQKRKVSRGRPRKRVNNRRR